MTIRTVTDSAGRSWTCTVSTVTEHGVGREGKDVVLSCATPSVRDAVSIRIGWQWQTMADNGLARMISQASPVPRR